LKPTNLYFSPKLVAAAAAAASKCLCPRLRWSYFKKIPMLSVPIYTPWGEVFTCAEKQRPALKEETLTLI